MSTDQAVFHDLRMTGAQEPDMAHDVPLDAAPARPLRWLDQPVSMTGIAVMQWLCFDGIHVTPVIDLTSSKLMRAGIALGEGEATAAADELRRAAAELRRCAIGAAAPGGAAMRAEIKVAQAASWRLASSAVKIAGMARSVEIGDIVSRHQLHAAIDVACSADLEQRWLVAEESVWFPACEELLRRFVRTRLAMTRRDYALASGELAQAAGFLRLEAARAIGHARRAIERTAAELAGYGAPATLAPAATRRNLERCFATACLSLALAHRRWGAELVQRGVASKAGHEFHALSQCLYGLTGSVEGSAGPAASSAAELAMGVALPLLGRIPAAQPALTKRIEALGRALLGLSAMVAHGQAAVEL